MEAISTKLLERISNVLNDMLKAEAIVVNRKSVVDKKSLRDQAIVLVRDYLQREFISNGIYFSSYELYTHTTRHDGNNWIVGVGTTLNAEIEFDVVYYEDIEDKKEASIKAYNLFTRYLEVSGEEKSEGESTNNSGGISMTLKFSDSDPVVTCQCRVRCFGDSINDVLTNWGKHVTEKHREVWL